MPDSDRLAMEENQDGKGPIEKGSWVGQGDWKPLQIEGREAH